MPLLPVWKPPERAAPTEWHCSLPIWTRRPPEENLETFLKTRAFAHTQGTTLEPDAADVAGFNTYIAGYKALLDVERAAVERV